MEVLQHIAQCVREPSTCVTTVQFWVAAGTGSALVTGFVRWATMKWQKKTVEDRLERIESGIKADKNRKATGDD